MRCTMRASEAAVWVRFVKLSVWCFFQTKSVGKCVLVCMCEDAASDAGTHANELRARNLPQLAVPHLLICRDHLIG